MARSRQVGIMLKLDGYHPPKNLENSLLASIPRKQNVKALRETKTQSSVLGGVAILQAAVPEQSSQMY
ncbi:hypothetical protein EVAR_71797_1 [Eumeta japonica]|uniref:Uncharacterized protein n=1 Tax=Eumeta variegata TaxID=151549 RepID=A0A4C1TR22_EUMVA|nr:hypothetical protein EVAR_71797_1 [Eumeta japonica]